MEITAWLERFVAEQRALAGAVYARAGSEGRAEDCDMLTLLASCNLDMRTTEVATSIQRGQGLAGLAFERKATLSTCTGRRPRAERPY